MKRRKILLKIISLTMCIMLVISIVLPVFIKASSLTDSAKKIILPGVFTALLIGGQLALSGISGIEVVTVLLLTFVYKYGIGQGLLVANSFSLLRCFIFGFMPNVIVLYLIYYNIFVLVFGFLGKVFRHEYSIKKHIMVVTR